jgi:hypothetical protein
MDGVLIVVSFFHKFKKVSTKNLADMLSQPPRSKITTLGTLMHMEPFTHDAYRGE